MLTNERERELRPSRRLRGHVRTQLAILDELAPEITEAGLTYGIKFQELQAYHLPTVNFSMEGYRLAAWFPDECRLFSFTSRDHGYNTTARTTREAVDMVIRAAQRRTRRQSHAHATDQPQDGKSEARDGEKRLQPAASA